MGGAQVNGGEVRVNTMWHVLGGQRVNMLVYNYMSDDVILPLRPRLGDSLFKVVAAGVAYFSLALVDGIMRSRTVSHHTHTLASVVTLSLLV